MDKTIELDTSDECSLCDDKVASPENPTINIDTNSPDFDAMDDSSYDPYTYDDSYYDMSDSIDERPENPNRELSPEDTADSSSFTDVHDRQRIVQPAPPVEIPEETFEENNNDPNNNMDSIEGLSSHREDTPAPGAGKVDRVAVQATLGSEAPRVTSPTPGCSKDSVPLPDERPSEVLLVEKTRHVLDLVSRINRDSVFEACLMNLDTPVSELRLWDLIPEADRREFPDEIFPNRKHDAVRKTVPEPVARGAKNSTNQTSTIKRGPNEDLCTIGCKRSASTPDISLSVPMVNPGAIPKVPSTSQIAPAEKKIVDETIKIRTVPLEQLKSNPCKVSNVVKTTATASQGAIPKVRAEPRSHRNSSRAKTVVPVASSTTISAADQLARKVKFASPVSTVSVYETGTQQAAGDIPTNSQQASARPVVPHPPRYNPPYRLHPAQATQTKPVEPPAPTAVRQQQPRYNGPVLQPAVGQLQQQNRPAVQPQRVRLPPSRPTVQPTLAQRQVVKPSSSQSSSNPSTGAAIAGQQQIQPRPGQRPQHRPAVQPAQAQQPLHRPAVQPAHPQQHRPAVQPAPAELPQHRPVLQPAPAQGQVLRPNSGQQSPNSPTDNATALPPHVQPANKAVCMEIYYKLINVFPNVDREYVKNICPADWAPGDRDGQLASLVEMILEAGDTVPRIVDDRFDEREGTEPPSTTPDEVYENLLGIFPDADPHYLREFAEKNVGMANSIKQFVERNLESRDYPTREQYMARLQITEQQRQYTHGFNVQQYLSIIPDPTKHFTDPQRRCKHSTVAFEFLKSYFSKMRVHTISSAYNQNGYNMSLTAEYLDRMGADMKSRRAIMEIPTEDISLLQEIAYIKHKRAIVEHISNAKKAEADEFNMMKAQNLLLECQCCFDAECVPSKCCNCENGHIFCNECVINGTKAKLGDGDTHIYCFTNCGSEFSLSVLQEILAPTTFSILLKKRQAAEVMEAGVEGLVSCPFCHFASIPPEDDKIFKCLNPECTKESCRLCKELSHVPLKCDEVMKVDKARLYIEEKMTAALARTCYKCKKSFFKEEGCNKITCVCGASMCYLCDQPIKDYSHFRGQGSNDQTRCPLYSDTIRLDAVAVRRVAEQAQLDVMQQNPNLRIDTRNLLPEIPRPQRGPHQDVLNADELPRRAQRVLNLPPPREINE